MKLCLLFVMVFTFSLSANVRAQQEKVSLKLDNVPVKLLFDEIQKQTNLCFVFNTEQAQRLGPISLHVNQESVGNVLGRILENTGLMYEFDGNLIIIRPEVQKQEGKEMRITGKVTDKKKDPLPGVTVLIKGTTIGAVTDANGVYQFSLPKQSGLVLVFSYIGMHSREVKVGDQEEINVVLEENTAELDEVVITGYGNVRKSSFTGNATSVNREELLRTNNKNVISALQSFDPSFRIRENTTWGSDPNALPEFNIRGESSIGMEKGLDVERMRQEQHTDLKDNPNLPVFIMDGFEVSVQKVYDMDMNRIENITILKDAAATALYGSRAANGVVVITTIAPQPGEMRVTYNGTFSIELPDLSDYNMCNAAEKLEVERLSGLFISDSPNMQNVKDLEYNEKMQEILLGVNTDWMAQPLRNSFNHKHSVYIDGGVETIRYALDLNYDSNGGVMKGSFRDRMGIGLALDYIYKKLQVRNYVSYRSTKSEDSPYGVFSDYVKMQPYYRIYDEQGKMIPEYTKWSGNRENPLYKTLLSSFSGRYAYNELTDNFNLNWYITEGLQFKGSFSITKTDSKTRSFIDPNSTRYKYFYENNEKGELTEDLQKGYNWTLNGMLYFNRGIGKHFINATAGVELMESHNTAYRMKYQGFPMSNVNNSTYAAQQKDKTSNTVTESRLFGVLASINYSYNNVYLFDASFRLDGSSQFGADKRFAPFWSVGTGLNIHNYNFLKESSFLSLLRVRGSYGSTGKVNFPSYTAVTTYKIDSDAWYYTGSAASLFYLGNNNLKWETTNTLDAGFEIGIKDGLFNLEVNYYHKETEDMIDKASIRESSGFKEWYTNAGSTVNKGFEIDLRSTVFRNSDWMVTVIGNLASNKNKITKLGTAALEYNKALDDNYNEGFTSNTGSRDAEIQKYLLVNPLKRYTVGASTTAIYAVRSAGIDPANGKERFIKKNGTSTYTWDSNDQVVVGDKTPKAQGTFGLNVSWRGIYMNASFQYQWGGQTYNSTLIERVENANITQENVDKRVLAERWKRAGDILPYNDINTDRLIRPTSRFVQDYNYLSFSGLAFGYDFPVKIIGKWHLKSLGLRFNATDLVRWSSVKEERGTSYPYAHTYSLSLNIGI